MSESEGLPALRRYRIRCYACGHEWKVRRRCIYPYEVSRLRRDRTDRFNSSINRGLTARPVVLAKNVRARGVTLPLSTTIRALRFSESHPAPGPQSSFRNRNPIYQTQTKITQRKLASGNARGLGAGASPCHRPSRPGCARRLWRGRAPCRPPAPLLPRRNSLPSTLLLQCWR